MQTEMTMKMKLIYDPKKGESARGSVAETLRAMADGIEKQQSAGGTPSGGHWSIAFHGADLDK